MLGVHMLSIVDVLPDDDRSLPETATYDCVVILCALVLADMKNELHLAQTEEYMSVVPCDRIKKALSAVHGAGLVDWLIREGGASSIDVSYLREDYTTDQKAIHQVEVIRSLFSKVMRTKPGFARAMASLSPSLANWVNQYKCAESGSTIRPRRIACLESFMLHVCQSCKGNTRALVQSLTY